MIHRNNYVVVYRDKEPHALIRVYCKACYIVSKTPSYPPNNPHCPTDGIRNCVMTPTFNNNIHEILATVDVCNLKARQLCHRECESCVVNTVITTKNFDEGV